MRLLICCTLDEVPREPHIIGGGVLSTNHKSNNVLTSDRRMSQMDITLGVYSVQKVGSVFVACLQNKPH